MAKRNRGRGEERDQRHLAEAIELARRGLEAVSPNPMVGCVVVKGGRVVGRGWHRAYGGPHAEVEALRDAGTRARGADVYVTLEPCGHQGKTPPCSKALIEAGVRRVVYAAADPNPLTRGQGPRELRRAGVEVRPGPLRHEALALNRPYVHFHRTGRPWVLLKWAMSLDGKIATSTGESRWITSRTGRAHGHALRRRVDAVLAGTETVQRDDPLLTPRPARGRRPWRVVLDRQGRLSLDLRLLSEGARGGPRLYAASPRVPGDRLEELRRRGLRTLVLPEKPGGLDLEYLLLELAGLGVSQVLVEGGGALAGSVLDRGFADEVAAFVAPRVLGGSAAPSPVGGAGVERLADALALADVRVSRLGADLLVQGVVRR